MGASKMALTVTIILAVLTTMTGIFWAATVDPLFGGFHVIWWWIGHGLGLGGITKKNTCLMTAYIVLAIISAIGAVGWGGYYANTASFLSTPEGKQEFISALKTLTHEEYTMDYAQTKFMVCCGLVGILFAVILPLYAANAYFFIRLRRDYTLPHFQSGCVCTGNGAPVDYPLPGTFFLDNPSKICLQQQKLSFNLCIGLIVFSFVLLIIGIASGVTAGMYHGVLGILIGALGIAGLHTRNVWIMLAFICFAVCLCIGWLIDGIQLMVFASKLSRNGYTTDRDNVSVSWMWIYIVLLMVYIVYQGVLAYYYFKARKEVVAEIYRDAFANLREGGMVILPAY